MAKMFYTLEEAAERLGVPADQVKTMASGGKLQQFRDRDKLMFKRDQVDSLAASAKEDSDVGEIELEDPTGISTGAIPMDEVGGKTTGQIPGASDSSDQIDIALEDELPGAKDKSEDSRMATGISVFDAGEIEEADPSTKTVVAPLEDEEELALESVGSGSGLLDLTQESDDTSLGAELLDEIYPGGEGSDLKLESPASSSGVFEPTAGFEGSSASGLEYHTAGGTETVVVEAVEEDDPAGNGLGIGMMLVGLAVLIVGLMIGLGAVMQGRALELTRSLTGAGGEDSKIMMSAGIALGAAVVLGLVGFFIGKSRE